MVEVRVLYGQREIGGTCIEVRDGDTAILFDQGLRFSQYRRFYSARVRPSGPVELRTLGVLPAYEVLEGASALYITHYHLDHLGLLGDVPSGLEVMVPSMAGLGLLEDWYRDSPEWTAYIPARYDVSVEEARPAAEDKNRVIALPVPHSAFPSFAYLYLGSDETVLYTGDFRFEHLSPAKLYGFTLFNYLAENPDLRVDKLVIEGTNVGRPVALARREDLVKALRELLQLKTPLLIALHRLELDLFLAVLDELRAANRRALIASPKLLDAIECWLPRLQLPLDGIATLPDLAGRATAVEVLGFDDLRDTSSYAVIADLYELVDFARGLDWLRGGVALLLVSEHEDEEGVEEGLALRWLRRLGFQPYRLRVSGHYYPHELPRLLELAKPREIIPVHTETPELLLELCRRFAR